MQRKKASHIHGGLIYFKVIENYPFLNSLILAALPFKSRK